MKDTAIMQRFGIKLGAYTSIFVVLAGIVFSIYLGMSAPSGRNKAAGRVYEYNYRGKVVYISSTERMLQYGVPLFGLGTFATMIYLERRRRTRDKNKKWPPDTPES